MRNRLELFNKQFVFYGFLITIFCLGWIVEQHIIFSRDTSWLLEASKRMFAGGNYINDFYENNPPWVLYFYLPAVVIAKYFSINILLSCHLFVFFLAGGSLAICWSLLQKIFFKEDIILAKIFLVTMAAVFLLLPSYDFGQREHLLWILSAPYLLLVAARLQGFEFKRWFTVLIGLCAGSVFLLKPYFIPTLMLVELFFSIKRRRLLAVFRPETIAMAVLGVLYAMLIVMRHMDYILEVMPFALRWCGLGDHDPWIIVLNGLLVLYSIFVLIFCVASYHYNRYQTLTVILSLALIGFLISYFIQHTTWYYHRYPAIALAFLMYIFLFSMHVRTQVIANNFILVLFVFIYYTLIKHFFETSAYYSLAMKEFPLTIFSFFVLSFILVLLLLADKYHKTLTLKASLSIAFLVGMIYVGFYGLTRIISPTMLNFILAVVGLTITLGLLFPGTLRQKTVCMVYTWLGVTIIAKIIFMMVVQYHLYGTMKDNFREIANFIDKQAANTPVYFFTTEISHAFPVITYSSATSASRFSHFWTLGGLVKQSYLPTNERLKQQQLKDKNYLIDMVSEDIRVKQPKLIFIDVGKMKNKFSFAKTDNQWSEQAYSLKYFDFDYLDYFLQNQNFKKVWRSYRYLTTLKENPLPHENMLNTLFSSYKPYEFAVYERI